MRMGLARVLCSPGFLFIQEPAVDAKPRKLTDYELASRLSYFLWSSMPDEELFTLAQAGRLQRSAVLMAQVDRMLDDPKSEALVEGFAGQWLNVREFGSVMPAAEYRDSYDDDLEQSSRLEAYAFFREVLSKDLPVTNFLDSTFVMINERLARHYGIEGVEGSSIRRVDIEPEHHRGGVLGMAGLMTYLSDGTRTLPVRRAAWVKTQLFGDPPGNPPPERGRDSTQHCGQRTSPCGSDSICIAMSRRVLPVTRNSIRSVSRWKTMMRSGCGARRPMEKASAARMPPNSTSAVLSRTVSRLSHSKITKPACSNAKTSLRVTS